MECTRSCAAVPTQTSAAHTTALAIRQYRYAQEGARVLYPWVMLAQVASHLRGACARLQRHCPRAAEALSHSRYRARVRVTGTWRARPRNPKLPVWHECRCSDALLNLLRLCPSSSSFSSRCCSVCRLAVLCSVGIQERELAHSSAPRQKLWAATGRRWRPHSISGGRSGLRRVKIQREVCDC
jgi:hypothetical protein